MKKSVVERLQANQRVLRQSRPEREKALENDRAELVKGLEKIAELYAQIDVARIVELERDTAELIQQEPVAAKILADPCFSELADDFGVVSEHLRLHAPLAVILRRHDTSPIRLNEISRVAAALASLPVDAMDIGPILLFFDRYASCLRSFNKCD